MPLIAQEPRALESWRLTCLSENSDAPGFELRTATGILLR